MESMHSITGSCQRRGAHPPPAAERDSVLLVSILKIKWAGKELLQAPVSYMDTKAEAVSLPPS